MSNLNILAIETSCDETSAAIIRANDEKIDLLANKVSSQVKLHAKWGGVVPNLAAREHVKNIVPIVDNALEKSKLTLKKIDLISVTNGPGLIPALLVGANFAKTLAYRFRKPLIGIHHIEGHIYSNYLSIDNLDSKIFPSLVLVVSGGHTQLVFMKDHLSYEIIGQTLDDAVGEAFDKVARILGLGYPGGPIVSSLAKKYEDRDKFFSIKLPRPMLKHDNLNFSFSGLKTAVLYTTKKHESELKNEAFIGEICAEFQSAITEVLIHKTIKAAKQKNVRSIMVAGGVSANSHLRENLSKEIKNKLSDTSFYVPNFELTGDNAGMIAVAAWYRWKKMNEKEKSIAHENWKNLKVDANLKLQ